MRSDEVVLGKDAKLVPEAAYWVCMVAVMVVSLTFSVDWKTSDDVAGATIITYAFRCLILLKSLGIMGIGRKAYSRPIGQGEVTASIASAL